MVLPVRTGAAAGGTESERARALALSEEDTASCYEQALRYYNDVIRTVNTLQLQQELEIGFTEFKLRAAGRYDMRVPAFDTLPCFGEAAPWLPLVKAILGDDAVRIHVGCMLSLPGSVNQVNLTETLYASPVAKPRCNGRCSVLTRRVVFWAVCLQNWHMDGDHLSETVQHPTHCLNVFVPLVDMSDVMGPTELLPKSHIDWDGQGGLTCTVQPCCGSGESLLFDYRLRHRGLANRSSKPRPMVYITYAKPFFQDTKNFSAERYLSPRNLRLATALLIVGATNNSLLVTA
jgi:hypothetical protein